MEIKRVILDEIGLVTDLFNQYRVFYKQKSDLALAEAFLTGRLKHNESIIFVALIQRELEPVPVGFTQLYPKYSSVKTTKNWILNDLYVNYDYRKKGIGEQLIKAAINFAKNENAAYVQLETAQDNQTAKRLYKTIGFNQQAADTEHLTYRIDL